MTASRPGPGKPERLFFPGVLLLAAAGVPLKAAESAGLLALPLPAFWHGHDMNVAQPRLELAGIARLAAIAAAAPVFWIAISAGLWTVACLVLLTLSLCRPRRRTEQ